jgi:hypothetical protein
MFNSSHDFSLWYKSVVLKLVGLALLLGYMAISRRVQSILDKIRLSLQENITAETFLLHLTYFSSSFYNLFHDFPYSTIT